MKRDILSILNITTEELATIIESAKRLKTMRNEGTEHQFLPNKTLGMIFEKASTRTRISFEVGMFELGGHALYLNSQDMQLGRGEEIRDTARVLSRYVSAVMIRAYRHNTIEELAANATVPVINGLSDCEHPCQIIADILTLSEKFGDLADLKVAWVGDGNNVCNSLILSSALTGFYVDAAIPPGYRPPETILKAAEGAGAHYRVHSSPQDAVKNADVIYTDTWISMGNEAEKEKRLADFRGFTIDESIMKLASPGAVVMHCLPAHRGEEITNAVIEGPKSIVMDQAENRLHAQKALLVRLLAERNK